VNAAADGGFVDETASQTLSMRAVMLTARGRLEVVLTVSVGLSDWIFLSWLSFFELLTRVGKFEHRTFNRRARTKRFRTTTARIHHFHRVFAWRHNSEEVVSHHAEHAIRPTFVRVKHDGLGYPTKAASVTSHRHTVYSHLEDHPIVLRQRHRAEIRE
jgi:hypothetical protein